MLISRNWLRDFVDLPDTFSPRELAERLTITMAEVDGIEHVTEWPREIPVPRDATLTPDLLDDWIIEIDNKSITHRPDLWGHYGVARELAAMLETTLRPCEMVAEAQLTDARLPETPITIDDPTKCARYSAVRMAALGSRPSLVWMQLRLARIGMRPISLLVDLTNYVMAELGQPMHAFDAATIDRIEVAAAAPGERFRTLDHVERVMPAGTLMIQRQRKSVAIAGIMGGAATEVTQATREILLESANFDAATIRRAAAAMGHRTEASARFEKSLDPNLTVAAIRRFVYLARLQLPELKLTGRLSDAFPAPLHVQPIELDPAHVSRAIGQEIPASRMASILRALEFDVREHSGRLVVTPPTFRATKDISIEADLIEEVARCVGYDKIAPALPRVTARPHDASVEHTIERRTIEALCRGGDFIEIQRYIWYDGQWLARLGCEPGPCVTLKNPVAPNCARLRQSLMPGLYRAADLNRHRMNAFGLLEIGSVFQPGTGGKPDTQQRHLGLCIARAGKAADADVWRDLKSAIEAWAAQVARATLSYDQTAPAAPWEDPIRTAQILLDGRLAGRITLVPLESRLRVDERMRTLSIGLAEIDMTGLDPDAIAPSRLTPPPPFPEVELDFSFVADARRRYARLADELRGFRNPLLRRLHFVDAYEGGSIPEGRRSFTFRTVVGAVDRTLNDADLVAFRGEFTGFLTALGLELRG